MNEPENSVELPDAAREIENLRLERDSTITFLAEVQQNLAEHILLLRDLGFAIEIKDEAIANLEREYKKLVDTLNLSDEYVASLENEHKKLKGLISIKDEYVASLESEHKKLRGLISVKDEYIASLESEHAKLLDLIAQKDQYTRSLQQERAALESFLSANAAPPEPQNQEYQAGPAGA